jgi:hypothetical protein
MWRVTVTSTPGSGSSWRKSSASGSTNCVEVALGDTGEGVLVRNSRSPEAGTLHFTPSEWEAFLAGVKLGEFDG